MSKQVYLGDETETHLIRIFGTGQLIKNVTDYLGSVITNNGYRVWHVYLGQEAPPMCPGGRESSAWLEREI